MAGRLGQRFVFAPSDGAEPRTGRAFRSQPRDRLWRRPGGRRAAVLRRRLEPARRAAAGPGNGDWARRTSAANTRSKGAHLARVGDQRGQRAGVQVGERAGAHDRDGARPAARTGRVRPAGRRCAGPSPVPPPARPRPAWRPGGRLHVRREISQGSRPPWPARPGAPSPRPPGTSAPCSWSGRRRGRTARRRRSTLSAMAQLIASEMPGGLVRSRSRSRCDRGRDLPGQLFRWRSGPGA